MSAFTFLGAPPGIPKQLRRLALIYLLFGIGLFAATAVWLVAFVGLLLSQGSIWFAFLVGALASVASMTSLTLGWGLLHGAAWSVRLMPAHIRAREEVKTYVAVADACPACGDRFAPDVRFCGSCGNARDQPRVSLLTQLTTAVRRLVVMQPVEPPRAQAFTRRDSKAGTSGLFFAAVILVVVGWVLAQWVATGGTSAFDGFIQVPIVAAALVPPALLLFWIRAQDRFEPEPLGLVLFAFAWGGLAHVWVHHILALLPYPFLAGLTEEIPKALVVLLIASHRSFRREFNGPVDGLVYGAASGLGFEAVDNFQLLLSSQDPLRTFFLTGAIPFTHMVWTGISGSWIGLMFLRRGRATPVDLLVAVVPAVALHGVHDVVLLLPLPDTVWVFLLVGVLLVSAFFFFKLLAEGLRDEAAWGYTAGKAPVEEFT